MLVTARTVFGASGPGSRRAGPGCGRGQEVAADALAVVAYDTAPARKVGQVVRRRRPLRRAANSAASEAAAPSELRVAGGFRGEPGWKAPALSWLSPASNAGRTAEQQMVQDRRRRDFIMIHERVRDYVRDGVMDHKVYLVHAAYLHYADYNTACAGRAAHLGSGGLPGDAGRRRRDRMGRRQSGAHGVRGVRRPGERGRAPPRIEADRLAPPPM